MEATGGEAAAEGLLNKILPPRLEDAGLEECALPPESIKEAFLKAASAVRSIVSDSSDDDEEEADEEGNCMNDPWPTIGDSSDAVVGIEDDRVYDVPGGCATEEKADEVVVPDDGLQGLEIGGKEVKEKELKDGDDEERRRKKTSENYVIYY